MSENIKQIAEEIYAYQQSHGYWDNSTIVLPLEELQAELDVLDSCWYVYDFDEWELRDTMEKAIDLANNTKLYEGYIELSDKRTLWDIESHISAEEYSAQVDDALSRFQEETGTKAYCLGRSGRHVCVENTYANASRLDELREKQRTIENDMVEFINSHYNEEELVPVRKDIERD